MRSHSDVEDRARFLVAEELQHRVNEAQKRLPHLCTHNHRQALDTRRQVDGEPNDNYNRVALPVLQQTIGLCMLGAESPENWPGNICEDPIDAIRCPYFNPKKSKHVILDELQLQLRDVGWVKENMPEVSGLLWTLNENQKPLSVPWWKRVWFWFLRIRVEPLESIDPDRLLPQDTDGSKHS